MADHRGDFVAQLTVSDGLLSSADSVLIRILNSTPVASAGTDFTTGVGTVTALDGSGSRDADREDTVTYHWTLRSAPSGSAITTAALSINDSQAAIRPTFVPDRPGQFVWGLVCTDNAAPPASSTRDDVIVTVQNTAPVAVATATPSTLQVTQSVQLDAGGSQDAETPGSLTYVWSFLRVPAGSSVSNASFVTTRTLVNPVFQPDRKGFYQVELRVSDGLLQGTPAILNLTVDNTLPVASAGADITTGVGNAVHLAGLAFDSNVEDSLVYHWRFASVPPVAGSTLTTSAFSPNDSGGAANTVFTPDRDGTYQIVLT
ncbi:MAG: peptidase-like protein, partial [Acidimicrobiaceae bacterium]